MPPYYVNPHARDAVYAVLAELLIGESRQRTLGTIGGVTVAFTPTSEHGSALLAIVTNDKGEEFGRFVIRARGI